MSVHHTTIGLLSKLSNRKKWGTCKEHHILASNSARASLTNQLPFPFLFPFPFPFPLSHQFIIPPLTTTPANPQALRFSLQASKASKQASKRPCRFRKISEFSYWCNPTYKSFIYRYTYLQAPRNKVFWSDTSYAYGFIRSLSRPSCEGRTFFLTPCM